MSPRYDSPVCAETPVATGNAAFHEFPVRIACSTERQRLLVVRRLSAEERPMKYLMMTVLLSVVTAPAWAQESGDAPEHGVARISVMSGDVTVRRGDSGEDIAAEVNAPLVALDHVFTNRDSRAELQFDSANFLRLAPDKIG